MIVGSACAAIVSVNHASIDRRDGDVAGIDECPLKARCVDSESRFLAMKKFSCSPASRLIVARQNRFLARIAADDSRRDFCLARIFSKMVSER
jgi:hypothetical protein